MEAKENEKHSQTSSANVPICEDLEKKALEIELHKQVEQEQKQNDEKKNWMKWLKNPDFYKVWKFYLTLHVVMVLKINAKIVSMNGNRGIFSG